jgi:hypothetical protein
LPIVKEQGREKRPGEPVRLFGSKEARFYDAGSMPVKSDVRMPR